VTTFTKRTCDRCDCQGRNVVRRLPGHVWPPMFEPEVLRKQMNLIEESTCEIVGIFWRSCSNSAPPEWFGTLGFATLAPDRYAYGCCNISVGVALDVLFTTNGMWAKKNSHIYLARKGYNRVIRKTPIYTWHEKAIIEWSSHVISIVACCYSVKLCALAAQAFRSQHSHRCSVSWNTKFSVKIFFWVQIRFMLGNPVVSGLI